MFVVARGSTKGFIYDSVSTLRDFETFSAP